MALQIAQWNLQLTLTGIPANRAYSPIGPNTRLILPTERNVLVRKITVDAIYNNSGDIIINDYNINFFLIHKNIEIFRNNFFVQNTSVNEIIISINKKNPVYILNEYIGGINILSSNTYRNQLILNNSLSPLNNTVSFLLTMYYDK